MEKEIPQIFYNEAQSLPIEVINFDELSTKLNQSRNHNPFVVHKIDFFLILIVTKGSYTHYVDFQSYDMIEGSAIFVAKNQVHHFTEELQDANGFVIIFNSLFTEKYHFLMDSYKFNRLFNYHIETPIIHQKEMPQDSFIDITTKLYGEFILNNNFAKPEMLSALLHVLLLKAERAKEIKCVGQVKRQWLETFSEFKNMLEKEYVKTRNSRVYASKLFVSYKLLNDIVKALTGKTVKAFIDEFVTIEIKRYLVSSALTVKEISYETGFEEPSNMVKFFKKHTNTTPLRFRQKI